MGYVNVALDNGDGGRSRKIIRNDPERWHLLKEGFGLYLTGAYSADSLRKVLYDKGLRSKNGKKIPHSVMVNTLKNPFYAGLMDWKGQRKLGRHEPMVTMSEHERIQEIVAAHNLYVARNRKHQFLLRGFVFCGLCGQRYTAEHHPAKSKSYYHCATMQGHSNRNQNILVTELEQKVEEQFRTIQFSQDFVDRVLGQLQHVRERNLATVNARRQVLCNQQKALEAKLGRAEEKLLTGVLPDDAFVRQRADISSQLQGIGTELAGLDGQRESDGDLIRHVLQMTRNVHEAYNKAPAALKRHYLGLFWDRFVVKDRHIVEAVPAECIRIMQEAGAVINLNTKLPSSPLLITLSNRANLADLAAKVQAIENYRAAMQPSCAA